MTIAAVSAAAGRYRAVAAAQYRGVAAAAAQPAPRVQAFDAAPPRRESRAVTQPAFVLDTLIARMGGALNSRAKGSYVNLRV